jgi:toxin ParE1/3/4
MAKVLFRQKAIHDLNNIWVYTQENWSEKQADKYYKMLLDICQEIAKNPEMGKNYDLVRPNLLGMRANKHVIFYQIKDNHTVEILRILHGQMDLKTILNF